MARIVSGQKPRRRARYSSLFVGFSDDRRLFVLVVFVFFFVLVIVVLETGSTSNLANLIGRLELDMKLLSVTEKASASNRVMCNDIADAVALIRSLTVRITEAEAASDVGKYINRDNGVGT
jgi:hypothetical protein